MPSKHSKDFEEAKFKDLKDGNVPPCLYWTCDDVCEYFENKLKLPEYKVKNKSCRHENACVYILLI